jgi:hypothetical protein
MRRAEEYRWSSAQARVNGRKDSILTFLRQFGGDFEIVSTRAALISSKT